MNRQFWLSVAVAVFASGLATAPARPAFAQDIQAISARWPQMSTADFVKEVLDSRGVRFKWELELLKSYQQAVYHESVRRFQTGQQVNPENLATLAAWASEVLSAEEVNALRTALLNQVQNNQGASFEEVQAAHRAQRRLDGPPEQRVAMVKQWLEGRELSAMSVDQLDWCARAIGIADGYINRGMHVRWTGTIRPPHDGQYKFSASPTQIQIDYPHLVSETSTKVFVGEQLVLEASGSGVTAQPILLSANQAIPIRVEFDYLHSGTKANAPHPAAAILSWEGPGIAKQLVPSSALAPPQEIGPGPGLLGEYTAVQPLDAEGNPQPPLTASGVDPRIDFLWTSGHSFLLRDRDMLNAVAEQLVEKATAPAYLAELHEPITSAKLHGWVELAELLTSAQRARWVAALAADPEALQPMSAGVLLRILHAFRVGAEEASIDLIGNWGQAHANDHPRRGIDYFAHNRRTYFWIADHFTYEFPGGCDRLEEEYLELPNGGCALPVAYIVAYSRAYRGQINEWIEALDARLAEQNLTGDQRASWLLARAQAEEIRGNSGTHKRFGLFPERYHAGWDYLNEASLVAESESTKLRVHLEKLTRCVSIRPHEVPELLATAKQQFTTPASAEALAQLEADLADYAEKVAASEARQAKNRIGSYVKQLERRRQKAEDANDSQAVARYAAMIEAAKAQEQPQE